MTRGAPDVAARSRASCRALADAAASHDVGARVADVEGQPVGPLGGAQNHEAGQGGSRGAHRVVGGCESRDRGGGSVDGDGEIDEVDGPVAESAGAQELLERDDGPGRGLGAAEVAAHPIGDREDGRDRQPGVLVFCADRTDVSRRAPPKGGALRMFTQSHLPSSFSLR